VRLGPPPTHVEFCKTLSALSNFFAVQVEATLGSNTAKVREIISYKTSSTALDFFNLILLILQVRGPHLRHRCIVLHVIN